MGSALCVSGCINVQHLVITIICTICMMSRWINYRRLIGTVIDDDKSIGCAGNDLDVFNGDDLTILILADALQLQLLLKIFYSIINAFSMVYFILLSIFICNIIFIITDSNGNSINSIISIIRTINNKIKFITFTIINYIMIKFIKIISYIMNRYYYWDIIESYFLYFIYNIIHNNIIIWWYVKCKWC
eukprot:377084_1